MDGLVFLASVVLFMLVVVVPVLAVMAWRRSNAARAELSQLQQRVVSLEQRLAGQTVSQVQEPLTAASPVIDTLIESEPEPEPEIPAVVEPAPVNVWAKRTTAAATPTVTPVPAPPKAASASHVSQAPDSSGGMVTSLVRWFMQGNPLAKLGIVLLFLGLGFLFRYSVENALFPLSLRLVFSAVGAMVLLFIGWRLRRKQPVFALILQGGATGALYMTVFGAFRLWQMLPMTLAFGLLLLICAASVALAVLQRALSLAMLASLGGYAAPILLSTGGGNYIALFSFYLLLSVGILVISVWQHWRELNLLGMLFTFGVAGIWGLEDYRPEYYLSCQLFLIANLILFGVLSVALSLRAQKRAARIVDGVLLFAPPLVGFGMQYAISQHLAWGPSLSALGFGAFYLLLAYGALKRFPAAGKPLVLASLALGGAFATLAIPLALSARWTAMAWALEGLGILWLGVMQSQRRMSYSGTGLLVLALGSALWALNDSLTALSLLVIFSVLSASWLVAAWLWRSLHSIGSLVLLAGGIAFWLVALWGLSWLMQPLGVEEAFTELALLGVSVWGWRYAAQRLAWRELQACVWLLWPLMLWVLLWQLLDGQHLLAAGWHNLAWCVALPSALGLLYYDDKALSALHSRGLHLALGWMILLAAGAELYWFVDALPWGMNAWRSGLLMAACGIVILLVLSAIRRAVWPFRIWPDLYGILALLPLLAVLTGLLILANLQDARVVNMLYLPLVNPLEVGAAFALMGLWAWTRFGQSYLSRYAPRAATQLLLGLSFWWLNGILLRALANYAGVGWNIEELWHSRLIQTTFALFWMLVALVVMLMANRRAARREWLYGAVLLGVVIVKLMLVDSAGGGGLARAVAFIGVAVLVLIVGYFSPLPPRVTTAFNEEEKP